MKVCNIYKWTLDEATQNIIQVHAKDWAEDLMHEGYNKKVAMKMALTAAENAIADTSIIVFGRKVTSELVAVYTKTDNLYDAQEIVTEWQTNEGVKYEFVYMGKVQEVNNAFAELLNR